MVVVHMARMGPPSRPEERIRPLELSASGKLLKKTDTTSTNTFCGSADGWPHGWNNPSIAQGHSLCKEKTTSIRALPRKRMLS